MRVFLLAIIAALLYLPGLGNVTMSRAQELRVTLTARNMAEGGDWLWPHYMGEIRLRKPPLMYWIVATAFRITGTTESAFVARLPSALAGILLVLGIYACGARLIGRQRALLAAFIAATSFILIRHARLAETDVVLSLLIVLATYCGFRAMTGPRVTGWWLLAGLISGLGFLVKGPASFAIPGLAWLTYALPDRDARRKLFSMRIVAGLLVCILVAAPWYVMILRSKSAQDAAETQIERELAVTLKASKHKGPVYYYAYTLPKAMLPWGVLLPFAVWAIIGPARRHRGLRFVLGWFVSTFVVLSAISSKQQHYALLLFPSASLALGWFLHHAYLPRASWRRALTRVFIAVLTILVGGALLVAPVLESDVGLSAGMGILFLIAGLATLASLAMSSWTLRLACIAAGLCLFTTHYAVKMYRHFNDDHILPELVALGRSQWANAQGVYVVGPDASVLQFYMNRPLQFSSTLDEAWSKAGPGDVIVASWNRKNPLTGPRLQAPPLFALENNALHCAMYIKKSGVDP